MMFTSSGTRMQGDFAYPEPRWHVRFRNGRLQEMIFVTEVNQSFFAVCLFDPSAGWVSLIHETLLWSVLAFVRHNSEFVRFDCVSMNWKWKSNWPIWCMLSAVATINVNFYSWNYYCLISCMLTAIKSWLTWLTSVCRTSNNTHCYSYGVMLHLSL